MPQISLKLSEQLYEELLLKKEELKRDDVSDVIRYLLRSALENHESENVKVSSQKMQRHALTYALMSYCLIEESLLNLAEDGSELCETAQKKAEKLFKSLMKKSPTE